MYIHYLYVRKHLRKGKVIPDDDPFDTEDANPFPNDGLVDIPDSKIIVS